MAHAKTKGSMTIGSLSTAFVLDSDSTSLVGNFLSEEFHGILMYFVLGCLIASDSRKIKCCRVRQPSLSSF